MRIVSGRFKGREIVSPAKNIDLRPTTDRAREAIFDVIRPEVEGVCFLDLFAGSGAVGLEALSEGAKFVVFVENNAFAVRTIQENIRILNVKGETAIVRRDVFKFLQTYSNKEVDMRFRLVFLDPPYKARLCDKVLSALANFGCLDEQAIIVAECEIGEHVRDTYLGKFVIRKVKEKKYGRAVISYFVCSSKES